MSNEIYASDENRVAKFIGVQRTGYVLIYKWICEKQSWLRYSKIYIDKCPFFLRRLFDVNNNNREFIGVHSDELGLRNVYEWR